MDILRRKRIGHIIWKTISTIFLAFCTFIQFWMAIGNLEILYQMMKVIIPIPSNCVLTDMGWIFIFMVEGVAIFIIIFSVFFKTTSVIDYIYMGIQFILLVGIIITFNVLVPNYNPELMGYCANFYYSRVTLISATGVVNIVSMGVIIIGRWYKQRKEIAKSPL